MLASSRPRQAAPRRLVLASLATLALGLVASGCGEASARHARRSANLIVLNGTLRTQKVHVVEFEEVDAGDMGIPLDEIPPGSHDAYEVERGEHTVITERFGSGHEPHRRAKLHFRDGMCHVVVLGPWPPVGPTGRPIAAPSIAEIVERRCRPGTTFTVSPDPAPR